MTVDSMLTSDYRVCAGRRARASRVASWRIVFVTASAREHRRRAETVLAKDTMRVKCSGTRGGDGTEQDRERARLLCEVTGPVH